MPPEEPEDIGAITPEDDTNRIITFSTTYPYPELTITDTTGWARIGNVGLDSAGTLHTPIQASTIRDLQDEVRDLKVEVESLRSEVHALSIMMQQQGLGNL